MERESRPEGPFGERTGYYATGVRNEPVVKVSRVMHRNDPIIQGDPPLKPVPGMDHLAFHCQRLRCGRLWNTPACRTFAAYGCMVLLPP